MTEFKYEPPKKAPDSNKPTHNITTIIDNQMVIFEAITNGFGAIHQALTKLAQAEEKCCKTTHDLLQKIIQGQSNSSGGGGGNNNNSNNPGGNSGGAVNYIPPQSPFTISDLDNPQPWQTADFDPYQSVVRPDTGNKPNVSLPQNTPSTNTSQTNTSQGTGK